MGAKMHQLVYTTGEKFIKLVNTDVVRIAEQSSSLFCRIGEVSNSLMGSYVGEKHN